MTLDNFDLDAFVRATLAEDMGEGGDRTSAAVIPADAELTAVMDSRDAVVVAGLALAEAFFRALDAHLGIERLVEDGARALPHNRIRSVPGPTRDYVDAIAGTGCILLDTRKTLPGLRVLEKYATRMGGATNHRMRLDDGVMIKDNHIAVAGGVVPAVRAAKAAGLEDIVVEVDRLDQIEPAIAAGADRLLLDNMRPATLREAVALVAGRVPTEASGGVRLETIRAIAETGVTYVSVGRITQSAPAADIGLDFA